VVADRQHLKPAAQHLKEPVPVGQQLVHPGHASPSTVFAVQKTGAVVGHVASCLANNELDRPSTSLLLLGCTSGTTSRLPSRALLAGVLGLSGSSTRYRSMKASSWLELYMSTSSAAAAAAVVPSARVDPLACHAGGNTLSKKEALATTGHPSMRALKPRNINMLPGFASCWPLFL